MKPHRTARQTRISRRISRALYGMKKERGWSYRQLEKRFTDLGYTIQYSSICALLRGYHSNTQRSPRAITVDELTVLAEAFSVSPTQLLADALAGEVQQTTPHEGEESTHDDHIE